MAFEAVIGLEIHAQLLTKTKIFCGCRARFGDTPNTNACPVCLGLPGALPVLNRQAVDMALRAGLAFGCAIAPKSIFARKNYFYPDLPKGYQISQYERPVCVGGYLAVSLDGVMRTIRLTRIHLEEDAGKLIHDQDADTLFDVNRCGTPLIEIVTEPDIRSPREAYAFLTSLKQILEYLEVCDCTMEEGSLRCDANISIRPAGETALGVKTELKNMNTFKGVEKALEYEYLRQVEQVAAGEAVSPQTFLWDAAAGMTVPMRGKESAPDYRYFPDPDLAPLVVDTPLIDRIRAALPELPAAKLERFISRYGLSREHAATLTARRPLADYFENTAAVCANTRLVAAWIMVEILRLTKEKKCGVSELSVTPGRLGALCTLLDSGAISSGAAKKILNRIEQENREPQELMEEMGLSQISDATALEQTVKTILEAHPQEAARYAAGDKKLIAFFMGQAMKMTKGKGNPAEMRMILETLLES